jgi:hypothetical protein
MVEKKVEGVISQWVEWRGIKGEERDNHKRGN